MFGLTQHERKIAKTKIIKSKAFLENNGIEIDNTFIPFANFCKSPYINTHRYVVTPEKPILRKIT